MSKLFEIVRKCAEVLLDHKNGSVPSVYLVRACHQYQQKFHEGVRDPKKWEWWQKHATNIHKSLRKWTNNLIYYTYITSVYTPILFRYNNLNNARTHEVSTWCMTSLADWRNLRHIAWIDMFVDEGPASLKPHSSHWKVEEKVFLSRPATLLCQSLGFRQAKNLVLVGGSVDLHGLAAHMG